MPTTSVARCGCREVGGTPVLFGYPLEQGYTDSIDPAPRREGQASLVRPQPQMERASQGQQMYFSRDRGHANAAGNNWIAGQVLGFLEAEGLLGAGGR